MADVEFSMEKRLFQYLERNGACEARDLYDWLNASAPSFTTVDFAELLMRLAKQGKLSLEDIEPVVTSFSEYLSLWDANAGVYAVLLLCLASLAAIYVLPVQPPYVAVRWTLGALFVLYLPGRTMIDSIFPSGLEFGSIEHFGFSIASSIVLAMLVGLLLNFTPWGLTLTPIVLSMTVLTIGFSAFDFIKRYRAALRGRGKSNYVIFEAAR